MKDKLKILLDKSSRTEAYPWFLGILCFVALGAFLGALYRYDSEMSRLNPVVSKPFGPVSISAKSAVVWDVAEGKIIYEKNADAPLPLASLTKVMTALTAERLSSSQHESVIVGPRDIETEGDSGLTLNSKWSLKSLIDYSLIVSSNDGASAIAAAFGADKKVFIKDMNGLGGEIGLQNSKFMNEHGLDKDEAHVGAYGSARDMARLFEYVIKYYPHMVEATKYQNLNIKDESGERHDAVNTNIIASQIPGLLASKTGYTDLAGGNLVIAYDAGLNHPVIISVLGSTQEGRFEDALTLVNETAKFIEQN